MAFGKKKAVLQTFDQSNVALLATEALAKTRATRVRLAVRLVFETPLLMQRWTTKAVRQMLGKMVGLPEPRVSKDLTRDFEDSWYRNVKGQAVIPCRSIKAAVVEAAPCTGDVVTKADLRRSLRIVGFTAPLQYEGEKSMSVMIVRNATGGPDVRSRAEFPAGATTDIILEFGLPLTPDRVMAALEAAGTSIGIGEWRPEKGGQLGMFRVEMVENTKATLARIERECMIAEESFVIPPEMLRAFTMVPEEKLPDPAKKIRATKAHLDSQRNGKSAENTDAE